VVAVVAMAMAMTVTMTVATVRRGNAGSGEQGKACSDARGKLHVRLLRPGLTVMDACWASAGNRT
jgi:hypothetical protein